MSGVDGVRTRVLGRRRIGGTEDLRDVMSYSAVTGKVIESVRSETPIESLMTWRSGCKSLMWLGERVAIRASGRCSNEHRGRVTAKALEAATERG